MLLHIVKLMGEDRIILGTDYPFPLGELEPGKLIDETDELSQEAKAKLLATNCLEFLGLERSKYL